MTDVRVEKSAGAGPPTFVRSNLNWATAGLRLVRLFLASRRVPIALGALAASGLVLRAALELQWIPKSGPLTQQLPVLLEAGSACVIAVTTYGPFGESELTAGRRLPYLRFGAAVTITGIAIGLLCAGAAAAQMPGGTLDIVRNVGGMAGIGLLSAAVFGGGLSWIGPMSYLVLSEYAILNVWRAPWVWPTRPPHDVGAALWAVLVFVGGAVVITARGVRGSP